MAKKKIKKPKKIKPLKTQEDREKEINEIKVKIISLGFSTEMKDIKTIFEIFDNYIITGESYNDKVPIEGTGRICEIRLTNRKCWKNTICLKYNQNV